MGRDVRHLHPVNLIVPLDHMVESVFPMHYNQRITVLIHKKESAVPVNHLFKPWRIPVLNDAPEAFCSILRHAIKSSLCCRCSEIIYKTIHFLLRPFPFHTIISRFFHIFHMISNRIIAAPINAAIFLCEMDGFKSITFIILESISPNCRHLQEFLKYPLPY